MIKRLPLQILINILINQLINQSNYQSIWTGINTQLTIITFTERSSIKTITNTFHLHRTFAHTHARTHTHEVATNQLQHTFHLQRWLCS